MKTPSLRLPARTGRAKAQAGLWLTIAEEAAHALTHLAATPLAQRLRRGLYGPDDPAPRIGTALGPLWAGPLVALITAVGFWAFYYRLLVIRGADTDIQFHLKQLEGYTREGRSLPGNVLFYLQVYMATGRRVLTVAEMLPATCIVLGLAWGGKVLATWQILSHLAQRGGWAGRVPWIVAGALVLALQVLFAWKVHPKYFMLGLLLPNIYHNSTTIALMPFALGAVVVWWRILRYGWVPGRVVFLSLLLVIGALAKPSFLLCFLPVYGLTILAMRVPLRHWGWAAVPALAGVAVLAGQHYLTFVLEQGSLYEEPSGVTVRPWVAMDRYLSRGMGLHVPNLLSSYLFIAVAALLYGRRLIKRLEGATSLALAVMALVVFALLAETGPRAIHPNFMWQIIVTHALVWAVLGGLILADLARVFGWMPPPPHRGTINGTPSGIDPGRRRAIIRLVVMTLVLGVHALAGVRYLRYMIVEGTFAYERPRVPGTAPLARAEDPVPWPLT